jgi:hypothetical protein
MSDPSSGAPSGSAAGVAAVLPADDPAAMARAAAALLAGQLVAFPTETVYGLGANALDPAAVLAIFRCKGRPLTDPVLCHVPDAAAAMRLFALPEEEGSAYVPLVCSVVVRFVCFFFSFCFGIVVFFCCSTRSLGVG